AREPSERYQAATELAEDLQRFMDDRPIRARRVSQSERLWRWCRRNPAVASLIGLIATVLVTVAVVATWAASRFGALAKRETKTAEELREAKGEADQARKSAENQAEEIRRNLEQLSKANELVQNADIRRSQNKFAEAYADYSKALDLQPNHSHLWTQRANLYLQLGLFPEAVLDWAEADKRQEPPTGTSLANYAMLRYYVGDEDGYRKICGRLLERFGNTPESNEIVNMVYSLTLVPKPVVDPTRLVQMAEAALAGEPRNAGLHLSLAAALYRAGRYKEAKRRIDDGLARSPQNEIHWPLSAMVHFRLDNLMEARRALDVADRRNEQWTEAKFSGAVGSTPLGWVPWLAFLIRYREAKKLIENAPPPEDPRFFIVRSRAFAALKRDDQADAEYAQALKQRPDDPQFRMHGFMVFAERGLWDRASAEYAEAVKREPNNAQFHLQAFHQYAEKEKW